MLHVLNISQDKEHNKSPYVISTHSKIAPIPMLMFSAVMYLVCISTSGKLSSTRRPETYILNKAENGNDRKNRGLPERQKHCNRSVNDQSVVNIKEGSSPTAFMENNLSKGRCGLSCLETTT